MPLTLPRESWQALCRRVSWSRASVGWHWVAARGYSGDWALVSLVVVVDEKPEPAYHRYSDVILATEVLTGRAAAGRLRRGVVSQKRKMPDDLAFPTQTHVTPQWLYSGDPWLFVDTQWPHYVFSGSVGQTASIDLSRPLQAPGKPYFPSVAAALAERIFMTSPGQFERGQPLQVLVKIPDRRGRIASIEFEDDAIAIALDSGRESGLKGFLLRAAWRPEPEDVVRRRHDEPVLGPGTVRVPLERVPAECAVALIDPVGRQFDYRSWNEQSLPAVEDQPQSIEALVARWLSEGEHDRLEYKRELTEARTRLSFAETVAAFANGSGGTILVGVDDEANPVGYRSAKGSDQVANIISELVVEPPSFEVAETLADDQPVLAVIVAPSPTHSKPHQIKGRVMVRTWGTTRAATPSQVRRLLAGG